MMSGRVPFIRQRDAMQCGVACLAMIMRFHGRYRSLESLERDCHATVDGVSLRGIACAAGKSGFETRSGKVAIGRLDDIDQPCIVHWNQNHFVVLSRVSGGKYRIVDPAKGRITYSREEFMRHWATAGDGHGIVMTLTLRDGGATDGDAVEIAGRHESVRRSVRFLSGYLRQYRKYFIQIFIGLLLGCGFQLIVPFMTQSIVDVGIAGRDIGFIWLVLLGELMIVIGSALTDIVRRWLLLHVAVRINITLVSDFFVKLLQLPMSFFDTKLTGDLLQRMGDHGRVQSFLTQQVLGILFALLSFVVFGTVLVIYNRLIFFVFLAGSVAYCAWIISFLSRRKVLDYEMFEQQAKNQGLTYRLITSMQEIKLQDCEKRKRWEWENVQADLFDVQVKALKLQQTQESGVLFINELKNILITVLAANAVIDGSITLGAMLAIQYVVGQLNSPVEQLMGQIYAFQDVKIALDRINEIHDRENDDTPARVKTEIDGRPSISIDRVSFRYDVFNPVKTLDDVSVEIEPGKMTAIVGASGSGKTTLIKLMLGYYPAEAGQIRVGDSDLTKYNLKWWRQQCGVVMQNGVIFTESIARNIAVDDGEVDYTRLEHAARTACIHDFVESLPLGYQTVVGEDGTGLSQGQRQRLLIARAVYKDPSFIFLDEATNSLDAENERAIVENLSEFYKGRTVVVVAHRLSTVRNADKIIVLDKGRIVEAGTHESLASRKGYYYKLVKNQLHLGD